MKQLITILLILLVSITGLYAQDIPADLGSASDYNLLILGEANLSSSDTEGRVAVGGNGYFTSYDIGFPMSGPLDILIVGDTLNYNNGNVYNGNVIYGTEAVTNGLNIPNGSLSQGTPLNFTEISLEMAEISRQWKLIPSNGTTTFQSGKITLAGADPQLNIFSVDGSDLSSANDFEINCPTGSTVLVNISGETISWTGGLNIIGTNKTKVVYNFYETYDLSLVTINVMGSILAPFAELTFTSGLIEGTVVVYNMTGPGQCNWSPFEGEVVYSVSQVSSDCEVTIKQTLTGTSFRVTPSFLGHSSVWAGTFLGYVNGHSTEFYCVDISHNLQFHAPYNFDKIISGPIKYIVNNYYPNVPFTGTNGQLSKKQWEAAAVQAALWHYSDGFIAENISNNNSIKNRAIEIIADALNKNPEKLVHFEIAPAGQLLQTGVDAEFRVIARDSDGSPLEGVFVEIETTSGTLSEDFGTTDASGAFVFTLSPGGDESASVTAITYDAVIPGGSRYKRPDRQTLVTNRPVVTCLETTASVSWTDDPLPGNILQFYTYNVTNSQISTNYVTDVATGDGFVVCATFNNGVDVYIPSEDEWQNYNSQNSNIPVDATTCAEVITFDGYLNDAAVGTEGGGLAYHIQATDEIVVYNTGNSNFTGTTIKDLTSYQSGNNYYLLIAHDQGFSLFNLATKEFTNYSVSNSNLPSNTLSSVAVDGDGDIWVGTVYGLCVSADMGASWTIYNTTNSNINDNIINSVEADGDKVWVGFYNAGLAEYDKTNDSWTNLTPYISTYPVDNLLYQDGQLFIGNYSKGLYVYDGENFSQYASVSQTGQTTIVEGFSFDGDELWVATQTGLARTMSGLVPSTGEAAILIDDKTVPIGGVTALNFKIVPDGDISYSQFIVSITYNSNELEFIEGNPSELLSGWNIHLLEADDGYFKFKASGNDPVTTEGTLFTLSFKVKESLTGAGLSAVYATGFLADFDIALDHSDLGIITFTTSGTANGGKGDANLDGEIDISDLYAVIHHLTYGGTYTLTGDGLANADVNEDDEVDNDDVSDILSYIFNGTWPVIPGPTQPGGTITGGNLGFRLGEIIIPIHVMPFLAKSLADDEFRNVTVTMNYNPDKINYASFSSQLLANGNFVSAQEISPGVAKFTFASPFYLEANLELGNMVMSFEGEIPWGETITTSYTIDGGDEQTGPTIVFDPTNVSEDEIIPDEFALYNNYPNPFNPETTIKFALPVKQIVTLKIYDVLGREVATLLSGEFNAGIHTARWNGVTSNGIPAASGIYFFRIEAGDFVQTNKMILLK